MESDQPPAETSDDPKPAFTKRSYECHFCKRGFTNAQALGGHMNIHRKDKNKSKHSSTTTATDTLTTNPFSISNHGNWLSATPQDEVKPPLSLFDRDDTAVQVNNNQPGNPSLHDGDVDLELRLGHIEPQPESSSEKNNIITTRKFF